MTDVDEEMAALDASDPDLAAAAWFHRLAAAKAEKKIETRRLFQQWLDSSPEHADAFARTTAAWNEIAEHAAAPEMMALREAAIADSRNAAAARWRGEERAGWNGRPFAIAASIVAAVSLGIVGYILLKPAPTQNFATKIGERETITLADNSRVDIDADSAISVNFTPERRSIHVLRGQAFFAVEKDPARPFVVESDGRNVIATGTQFDVEKLDKGMRVTLVEGHVIVRPVSSETASDPSEELEPNDQLTEGEGTPPRLVHLASTLEATAWRQGKLLFDNEPLSAAVARISRYSHVEVVADASVADLKISGAFDAGDIAAFVDAVKAYYPVDAVYARSDELRLTRRR